MTITPVPGQPNLLLGAFDVATLGYRTQEFFIAGTAKSYEPAGEAEYTTRIVALTPDASAFNGTVIVEWLNVSGGIDAPAVWMMAHREIAREGYAYVAASVQRVGIDGQGLSLGMDMSLKTLDAERYSDLQHPGDAFAFDIFSQVGRLVRDAGETILDGLRAEHVLAVGESQSAVFLTTYVNAVDPLAEAYDGFLVHSRFGPAAPLEGTTLLELPENPPAVRFRTDLRVPVLTVITESDLLGAILPGYYPARQPDNDRLRVWEIAGTAHADNYTVAVGFIDDGQAPPEQLAAAYAPTNTLMGQHLSHCINFAPQHHYVLQAAVAALHDWIRTGAPAPSAPPISVAQEEPLQIALDSNGLAEGGVRTPWVDVPVGRTSGAGTDESALSVLFGSGELFDPATLSRLYPGGPAEYVERFTAALDRSIASGFIRPADRSEILALAAAGYPAGGR